MKTKETAGELMARLNKDPAYLARNAASFEAFRKQEEALAEAETPLVHELQAAGVRVDSVWDLVNNRNTYQASYPILLKHLSKANPTAVREGIARALAVPEARFAWKPLLGYFVCEKERRVKDGLAVALANVADDSLIDEVIALLNNPEHGPSRVLLLNALERSRLACARQALLELASDPELQKEIAAIRRRTAGRK